MKPLLLATCIATVLLSGCSKSAPELPKEKAQEVYFSLLLAHGHTVHLAEKCGLEPEYSETLKEAYALAREVGDVVLTSENLHTVDEAIAEVIAWELTDEDRKEFCKDDLSTRAVTDSEPMLIQMAKWVAKD